VLRVFMINFFANFTHHYFYFKKTFGYFLWITLNTFLYKKSSNLTVFITKYHDTVFMRIWRNTCYYGQNNLPVVLSFYQNWNIFIYSNVMCTMWARAAVFFVRHSVSCLDVIMCNNCLPTGHMTNPSRDELTEQFLTRQLTYLGCTTSL